MIVIVRNPQTKMEPKQDRFQVLNMILQLLIFLGLYSKTEIHLSAL